MPNSTNILHSPVLDSNGQKLALNELFDSAAILVFVRHFGCAGCAMQMKVLSPRLEEFKLLGIPTIVIGNGEARYIDDFMNRFGLHHQPVKIVTDPTLEIFKHANFKKSFWATYGPKALWDYITAAAKGIVQTSIDGNLFQQGGTILLNYQKEIVFYHQNKHVSDLSDLSDMVDEIYKILPLDQENNV